MMRRDGVGLSSILIAQNNLAGTYESLGRNEEALELKRDVYSRRLELLGEEHVDTFTAGTNYAMTLRQLGRYDEVKTLTRKMMPVARRVLGERDMITLSMRTYYAQSLYKDNSATLDDLREAVATLEETTRLSKRVLGNLHPITGGIVGDLQQSRAMLRYRETQSRSA